MTESEWIASVDPAAMLAELDKAGRTFASAKVRDRKLRLFACACALGESDNKFDHGLSFHEEARYSELVADGIAEWKWGWSWVATKSAEKSAEQAIVCPNDNRFDKSALLREIVGNPYRLTASPRRMTQDYYPGPCYEQVEPWLTPHVQRFAADIYDRRDFDLLPILGDAAEEAECTDEAILRHCRGQELCPRCKGEGREHNFLGIPGDYPCDGCKGNGWVNGRGSGWIPLRGPHVRGCWVLDLILGKE